MASSSYLEAYFIFMNLENDLVHFNQLLDFKTPNTYGENFSVVPKVSGVYFYVTPYYEDNPLFGYDFYKILYIGSSKNLYNRYNNHEVGRVLKNICNVQFYFVETKDYISIEKNLINKIKPICNYQHNKKNSKRYFNLKKIDII